MSKVLGGLHHIPEDFTYKHSFGQNTGFYYYPFFSDVKTESKWPHCLYMILLVRAKSNADVVQKITATNTSYLLREKRLFVQKLLKSDNGKFSYPQTVCVVFPLPLCYTRFSLMPDPWLRF